MMRLATAPRNSPTPFSSKRQQAPIRLLPQKSQAPPLATAYDEDTRGGVAATFKCEMKTEKEKSKAVWSGMSTGSDISGELTITTSDGSEQKYTFKGERQQ